jgi:molecular chaperone Hsp33
VIGDAVANKTYPDELRRLLAQMFAAVAMFADNIKFEGTVALQSRGNSGPMVRSLAECRDRRYLRGILHLQDDYVSPQESSDLRQWLHNGQLALNLIPDRNTGQVTYQGLVALEHPSLAANLESYFATSEQLPTRIFFATTTASVTALLLQRLPSRPDATDESLEAADEAWRTLQILAETVTEAELQTLAPAPLLGRLFGEYPCRLHPARALSFRCSCSKRKSDRTLRVLTDEDVAELLEQQGAITVGCEFCGAQYRYDAIDIAALNSPPDLPQGPPPMPGSDVVH